MLLFTDGFERFHHSALHLKWPVFYTFNQTPNFEHTLPAVVTGDDAFGKPHARKNGRALCFTRSASYSSGASSGGLLGTTVRKSRQLFFGFAFKTYSVGVSFFLNFYSRTPQRRGNFNGSVASVLPPASPLYNAGPIYGPYGVSAIPVSGYVVSSLKLTIVNSTTISCSWFSNDTAKTTKIGQHNTVGSLVNGDYRYVQAGISVVGGSDNPPNGWCETRIGNRGSSQRFDDVRFVDFGSSYGHYIDFVSLGIFIPPTGSSAWIDDVYICNDEGDVNNQFLGNCIVRSAIPELDGFYNSSEPINGGPSRKGCVSSDFFGLDEMPHPVPDPATNPSFIPWTKPLESYIRLYNEGDKQSFKFSNIHFDGSEPQIYGMIEHSVVRTVISNHGKTSISPFIRVDGIDYDGNQEHFPLVSGWSARYLSFDNKDLAWLSTGFFSPIFNSFVLSVADIGYRLERAVNNLYFSSPAVIRYNVSYDVTIYDELPVSDFCHRHIDEYITVSFNSHDDSDYEKTFAIYDYFQIGIIDVVSRANYFWVSDNVIYSSYLPMIDEIIVDGLSFDSNSFVVYETYIETTLSFDTWITTKPVESVSDYFMFLSALSISHGELVFSDVSFDILIGHNFEDVESPLDIVVSYIFSGHEFADDYLDIDDFSVGAHVVLVGDDIVFTDWHFDGHHVEEFREQFSLTDSVLTQHWRHEFIFFVCISSWQISPVEQPGNDGNRVGQLTSQIDWYNSLM